MMIRAARTLEQASRRYSRLSAFYAVNARLGSASSTEALRLAALQRGETVLELGVGVGQDLIRIADLVTATGRVLGIDAASGMLHQARRNVTSAGLGARVWLQRGDARQIPLADGSVDVVFCSRLLDLVDTPQIPGILAECLRVLRPAGRIVLVHMSKRGSGPHWFERLYVSFPGFGGGLFVSRPVQVAPILEELGFRHIARLYRRAFPVGTEIVSAAKAA